MKPSPRLREVLPQRPGVGGLPNLYIKNHSLQ